MVKWIAIAFSMVLIFKEVRQVDVQSYRIHSIVLHNLKFEGDVNHAFIKGISAK